jgi:hypothetical protein
MTVLPIPTGPTNREIIDRAFQILGQSNVMFGRTDEDYADAILTLNAMIMEWPFSEIGFYVESEAGLRVDEESGISRAYLNAVAHNLAEQMASTSGKTLSPEARKTKNRSYSRLCGAVQATPAAQFADGTVRGSGWRRGRTYWPPAV